MDARGYALGNENGYVATLAETLVADEKNARLILKEATDRVGRKIPQFGKFCDGIVAFLKGRKNVVAVRLAHRVILGSLQCDQTRAETELFSRRQPALRRNYRL
ncbi:MAG TPA: hypothetical protein VI895_08180 [Bdellovibrionota bacterium]|nr:hypothetical protein [Bdellovibrionota bacterium]